MIKYICPYCNRLTEGESRLVRLDGVVYSACDNGEGCSAEYKVTWPQFLRGELVRGIPIIVIAAGVIMAAEKIWQPYETGITAEVVILCKIVAYGCIGFLVIGALMLGQ